MATPTLPTSPEGERMVRVHADLRGQIEGDGEAGPGPCSGDSDSAGWIRWRSRSRRTGRMVQKAAAVHRRVDAASERVFARIAEGRFRFGVSDGVGIVDAFKWNAGEGGEFRLAFGGGGFDFWRRTWNVEHNKQQKHPRPGRGPLQLPGLAKLSYSEKNANRNATAMAAAMSQCAGVAVPGAQRSVQPGPNARTANTAAVTS